MQILYLTPASIGYLTQFILSLAITGYLARRLRKRENQSMQTLNIWLAHELADKKIRPTWTGAT